MERIYRERTSGGSEEKTLRNSFIGNVLVRGIEVLSDVYGKFIAREPEPEDEPGGGSDDGTEKLHREEVTAVVAEASTEDETKMAGNDATSGIKRKYSSFSESGNDQGKAQKPTTIHDVVAFEPTDEAGTRKTSFGEWHLISSLAYYVNGYVSIVLMQWHALNESGSASNDIAQQIEKLRVRSNLYEEDTVPKLWSYDSNCDRKGLLGEAMDQAQHILKLCFVAHKSIKQQLVDTEDLEAVLQDFEHDIDCWYAIVSEQLLSRHAEGQENEEEGLSGEDATFADKKRKKSNVTGEVGREDMAPEDCQDAVTSAQK